MSSKGTALVTGAAQGIGRAIALRLASDGFAIALNDLPSQSAQLENLTEEIQSSGVVASVHTADVSQEEQVKAMIEDVVEKHGGLDIMVANAGIVGPTTPLTQVSAAQWDLTMSINARSIFLCYKYAGLQMIKQGRGGRMIGASSAFGKQAAADFGPYCASKFAVRGLTQSAAQEFGKHGITVNAYAPGAIDAPMLRATQPEEMLSYFKEKSPLKTLGLPSDIAAVVSFIASKQSGFITGQTISIEGGGFYFD